MELVTLTPTLVVVNATETVISIDDDDHEIVVPHESIQILEVAAQGPAGAMGLTGASGAGAVEIPFAFGDATPKTLVTAGAGKLAYRVAIHISTAFDGSGAALQIGDAGDPARLMAASQSSPGEAGSYETSPNHRYVGSTVLLLTITPGGGATQGAGIVTLQVQQ